MATARAASITPSTALPDVPVVAGVDMVDNGVGEGLGLGGGAEVAEGDGGGGVAGGEVGAVVAVAGAWVASTMGVAGDVAISVCFVSVGATLMLGTGVGEGGGASVGVSVVGLVTIGVGEGRAVAVGRGVSIAGGVCVGMEVAVAAGATVAVAPGAGVAVGAGTGVAVAPGAGVAVTAGTGVAVAVGIGATVATGVGASVLPTMTRPFSTVTRWTLAIVSSTWTFCNPKSLLPCPWAMQAIVAKMPVPLGPGVLPKLTPPRLTLPSALSTSGPMGTVAFPVLPKKSPREASVTCRMDGSKNRFNWKAPRLSASSITTWMTKVSPRPTAKSAGSILTRVSGAIALTPGIPAEPTIRVSRRMMTSCLPLGMVALRP